MKTVYGLVVLLLIGSAACSQNREYATAYNGWYMYFGNHKVAKKLALHTEYQWRRSDIVTLWQQSLARTGLDYLLNDHSSLSAGYGFITSWPYGEQPVSYIFHEHRLWQQLMLKHRTGRFYFNHRYRMEERWMEQKKIAAGGRHLFDRFVYRNRLRYRFLVSIPLSNPELEEKTWFASIYTEAFISFGKNVARNIFDQHRLYAAAGYQFTKNTHVQLGYLYHTIIKGDALHIENNHTLQLAFTYNFDFTRHRD